MANELKLFFLLNYRIAFHQQQIKSEILSLFQEPVTRMAVIVNAVLLLHLLNIFTAGPA
jgi:hypothetical protein